MRLALLIALYAAWPLAVVVAKVTAPVRTRFLLVWASTWVLALAIGTTAAPREKAPPLGLIIGAGCCLFLVFVVKDGVTFTWSQHKTYFADGARMLLAEASVVFVVGVVGASAVALLLTG